MNSYFKAVLGSQQIWEENTEFVNSPPHTDTHTHTHTHTHRLRFVLRKWLMWLWILVGLTCRVGGSLENPRRLCVVVFCFGSFEKQSSFFLEGAQCFLLKLATEWMKLWKVIYFIQSLWLNVNYIFTMPSEKQTNWFDQASEYYNPAKLIQN